MLGTAGAWAWARSWGWRSVKGLGLGLLPLLWVGLRREGRCLAWVAAVAVCRAGVGRRRGRAEEADLMTRCPGALDQGLPQVQKRIFPNISQPELDLPIPNMLNISEHQMGFRVSGGHGEGFLCCRIGVRCALLPPQFYSILRTSMSAATSDEFPSEEAQQATRLGKQPSQPRQCSKHMTSAKWLLEFQMIWRSAPKLKCGANVVVSLCNMMTKILPSNAMLTKGSQGGEAGEAGFLHLDQQHLNENNRVLLLFLQEARTTGTRHITYSGNLQLLHDRSNKTCKK